MIRKTERSARLITKCHAQTRRLCACTVVHMASQAGESAYETLNIPAIHPALQLLTVAEAARILCLGQTRT